MSELELASRAQWRAEAAGCPGPTRFLECPWKYFLFVSQNFWQPFLFRP